MSNLTTFASEKYKIGLGDMIYVYSGNYSTGGTTQTVLGDFVKTNTWLSKAQYADLYNILSFDTKNDCSDWDIVESGTTSEIKTFTFGNGLYVYGTTGGGIGTSTDAITWTARTSGTTSTISSVVYGNGLYVYVTSGGGISTSTDAVTWTARTSGTANNINNIIYANGLYIYVGNSGVLGTSTDAITWTARTSGTTSTITSVVYGNGLYVYGGSAVLSTSTDAITWTVRLSGFPNSINGIVYANQKYTYVKGNSLVGNSNDAITWTEIVPGLGGVSLNAIINNAQVYILAAASNIFASSTDALTWTNKQNNFYGNALFYANNKYLSGGAFGKLAVSKSLLPTSTEFYLAIDSKFTFPTYISNNYKYLANLYVKYKNTEYSGLPVGTILDDVSSSSFTVDRSFSKYITSPEICNISSYPELYSALGSIDNFFRLTNDSITYNDMVYNAGVYVLVGNSGTIRSTTNVGITPTSRTSQTTSALYGATFGNGIFAVAGFGGALCTSTNGTTWTARTSGTTSQINSITFGNGIFVYAGNSGVLRTSTDAITWTDRTSGTTSNINTVVYVNSLYIYGADAGTLRTSTDAVTWTARTSGTTNTINSITFGNGLYVYGGAGGIMRTSTDTINWYIVDPKTTDTIRALLFHNNKFLYGAASSTGVTYIGIGSSNAASWLTTSASGGLGSRSINRILYADNGYAYCGSLSLGSNSLGRIHNIANTFIVPEIVVQQTTSKPSSVYVKALS